MKRGASQIDWIISLALFLLYIAWFFTFMAPSISFNSNKDSLMVLIKQKFNSEFEWQLEKYPLFIEDNNSNEFLPVMMEYNSNNTDIKFIDGTDYMLWNNKLIFLANLTNTRKTLWVLKGWEYEQEFEYEGLISEENWTTAGNISVKFEDSLPTIVYHEENEKISNIVYTLNEIDLEPETKYVDSGFGVVYTAQTGNINHTSMIFAYNSDIYNFITTDLQDSNYVLRLNMVLDDYESYHSNNLYYGDFSYSSEIQNTNYSYDEITFYNSGALTMFFDNDVYFNMTYYNTTLNLQIDIPISGSYEYRFIFHNGDYDSANRQEYHVERGVSQKLEGLYLSNISQNYSHYKEKWNYPDKRNFNIRVFKNTSKYRYLQDSPTKEIGVFNPGNRNVHADNEEKYALDTDGEYTLVNINYRIW